MGTKKQAGWATMPAEAVFDFSGERLKTAWKALHAGDGEPYPDERRAKALLNAVGRAAPEGLDAATLGTALQQGWQAFHEGRFEAAFKAGEALGPIGASLATKALGIHATYLVDDADERMARFHAAAELAAEAAAALPDEANSHYRRAFALGRYSQCISIGKALAAGLAGKVRASLDQALALNPDHAEARLALAVYHAEVVGKVGSLLAGLTYGAKAADAEKQIALALKLTPKSPIAFLEQGNVALLLHGTRGEEAAAAAYEKAAALPPIDAMEWLDAREAAAQIE